MLDIRSKNKIMPIVVYALAIFFTISSVFSIFTNVSALRFMRNNNHLNDDQYFLINYGIISLVLVVITLIAIVMNLLIKNSDKCDKVKRISDLTVIITSLLTAILLVVFIFIMRANLPTWGGEISLPTIIRFVDLKALLLQPVMTLLIIGVIHLYDLFVNSKKSV